MPGVLATLYLESDVQCQASIRRTRFVGMLVFAAHITVGSTAAACASCATLSFLLPQFHAVVQKWMSIRAYLPWP